MEQEKLKLSDSFLQPVESPDLELVVTLFNINAGHNKELMEECQILKEYGGLEVGIRT